MENSKLMKRFKIIETLNSIIIKSVKVRLDNFEKKVSWEELFERFKNSGTFSKYTSFDSRSESSIYYHAIIEYIYLRQLDIDKVSNGPNHVIVLQNPEYAFETIITYCEHNNITFSWSEFTITNPITEIAMVYQALIFNEQFNAIKLFCREKDINFFETDINQQGG